MKFDDAYNTTRIPSWTDRILYYSKEEDALEQFSYDCNNILKLSDHRPVFSQFQFHFDFIEGFATLRKDHGGLKEMLNGVIARAEDGAIINGPLNKLESPAQSRQAQLQDIRA